MPTGSRSIDAGQVDGRLLAWTQEQQVKVPLLTRARLDDALAAVDAGAVARNRQDLGTFAMPSEFLDGWGRAQPVNPFEQWIAVHDRSLAESTSAMTGSLLGGEAAEASMATLSATSDGVLAVADPRRRVAVQAAYR
jgi:hypothetical protein